MIEQFSPIPPEQIEKSTEELQRQVEILLRYLTPEQMQDPLLSELPVKARTEGIGKYISQKRKWYQEKLTADYQQWGEFKVKEELQRLIELCEDYLGKEETARILNQHTKS